MLEAYELGKAYSDFDVWQVVHRIHPRRADFEEGNIRERIFGFAQYKMSEIPVEGCEIEWWSDKGVVQEYSEMDPETMPPIVLGEFSLGTYDVIDGVHRLQALKLLGQKTVRAFVGVGKSTYVPEDEEDDADE